jgi:hypothetical protein
MHLMRYSSLQVILRLYDVYLVTLVVNGPSSCYFVWETLIPSRLRGQRLWNEQENQNGRELDYCCRGKAYQGICFDYDKAAER